MTDVESMIGRLFGRLTVIRRVNGRHHSRYALCACSCGNETTVEARHLVTGNTQSCGCLQPDRVTVTSTTHGGSHTNEYRIWVGMRGRCHTKTNKAYPDYGGRGITVCERWQSFENFRADMGPRPSLLHSLERLNNDAGYSPGNTIWSLRKHQQRNRRANHRIDTPLGVMCMAEAAERFGVTLDALRNRLRRGWPPSRLFEQVHR